MTELSKAHTTSDNQNWETPKPFFHLVEKILGWKFTTDLAASDKNHLCDDYYTKENNAFFNLPWVPGIIDDFPLERLAIWCNPPYSDKKYSVKDWVFEAWDQQFTHSFQNFAFLLPMNKMDQDWFHFVMPFAWIGIVKGRIQFTIKGERQKRFDKKSNKWVISGNSQGSIVVAFGPELKPGIHSINWKENKLIKDSKSWQ